MQNPKVVPSSPICIGLWQQFERERGSIAQDVRHGSRNIAGRDGTPVEKVFTPPDHVGPRLGHKEWVSRLRCALPVTPKVGDKRRVGAMLDPACLPFSDVDYPSSTARSSEVVSHVLVFRRRTIGRRTTATTQVHDVVDDGRLGLRVGNSDARR